MMQCESVIFAFAWRGSQASIWTLIGVEQVP
jgi:hypothetical protein